MDKQKKEEQNKFRLFYGSIIFGFTIAVGFFIVVHFGSQIEFQRDNSTFLDNVLLWMLEWIFILIGIGLPFVVWIKLVKPYKDF